MDIGYLDDHLRWWRWLKEFEESKIFASEHVGGSGRKSAESLLCVQQISLTGRSISNVTG